MFVFCFVFSVLPRPSLSMFRFIFILHFTSFPISLFLLFYIRFSYFLLLFDQENTIAICVIIISLQFLSLHNSLFYSIIEKLINLLNCTSLHTNSSYDRSALLVQLYLRMDRHDLAEKQVKIMKAADEDSTLSMLSHAWTLLSSVRRLFFLITYIYCHNYYYHFFVILSL